VGPPAGGGAVDGIGLVGALVYFLQGAESGARREVEVLGGRAWLFPLTPHQSRSTRLQHPDRGPPLGERTDRSRGETAPATIEVAALPLALQAVPRISI
jgi:hypothetical protein